MNERRDEDEEAASERHMPQNKLIKRRRAAAIKFFWGRKSIGWGWGRPERVMCLLSESTSDAGTVHLAYRGQIYEHMTTLAL